MSSSIIPPYVLENVQSVFTAVAEQGNATLAALHASNHPLAQAAVSGPFSLPSSQATLTPSQ